MRFRVPSLNPPEGSGPDRLNILIRKMGLPGGKVELALTSTEIAEARRLVDRQVGSKTPLSPPRSLIRGLLRLLAEEEDDTRRGTITGLLLSAESLGWRRLWNLWELAPDQWGKTVPILANRLWHGVTTRPRFRERLPGWLPVTSMARLAAALERPGPCVVEYCQRNSIPLTALPTALDVMNNSRAGLRVVSELIRSGHDGWWHLVPGHAVRSWAEDRKVHRLMAMVLNRQLTAKMRARVSPHGGLDDDTADLVRWGIQNLGDPALRAGSWTDVSKECRDFFESLMLADTFGKILDEFRRHANDDRAAYWAKRFSNVRDALYYEAKDSAVCMMVVQSLLVVEFGKVGNACYVYRVPVDRRPLRTLKIRKRLSAGHFKEKGTLRIDGQPFTFLKSLNHTTRWQSGFDSFFYEATRRF